MKKPAILIFCVLLCCALVLPACGKPDAPEAVSGSTPQETGNISAPPADTPMETPGATSGSTSGSSPAETQTAEPAAPEETSAVTPNSESGAPALPDSPAITPEPSPWIIDWDPHASGTIFTLAYGEDVMSVYHELIDAVETGADSVRCSDRQQFSCILTIMHEQYPLYGLLLSGIQYDEQTGAIWLTYAADQAEREALIMDFQNKIQEIVSGCVYDDYSTVERAAALHNYLSRYFIYDYAAADAVNADVSPYRAIMTGEGICQSFTGAYTYIALQLGIDAASASGMPEDYSVSHEWNVIILNGERYYSDVTFENVDGCGLRYFGMTGAQREAAGGFVEDMYNIGNTNELWGRDFPVTDERFSPLWSAVYLNEFVKRDGRLAAHCMNENGRSFVYEF